MTPNRRFDRWIPLPVLGLLAVAWLVCSPATAQTVEVNSADPPGAPQGTVNLDVTIKGNGFGRDSQVRFLVTGTNDPGGVVVNSVKTKGAKTLVANIDVDAAAVVGDFDIEVLSAGRTGKGTELFAVSQASGGGADSTPPGVPTDFTIDGVDSVSMSASWTETADDGYDPVSGPVWKYTLKYRTDAPLTDQNWDDAGSVTIYSGGEWGSVPGSQVSMQLYYFEPGTTYYVGVIAEDEVANRSSVASFGPVTTLSFTSTFWSSSPLGQCQGFTFPSFDIDSLGLPGVAYSCDGAVRVSRWTGTAWQTETLSISIGYRAEFFAFDPASDEPTLVHAGPGLDFLRRGPSGWTEESIEHNNVGPASLAYWGTTPVVVYQKSGKKNSSECRLARKIGNSWQIEVVDPDTLCRDPSVAFDSAGNPAVSYRDDLDGDGSIDGLRVATRDAATSAWTVLTLVDGSAPGGPNPGGFGDDPFRPRDQRISYDPSRDLFTVAYVGDEWGTLPDGRVVIGPSHASLCEPGAGGGAWSCSELEEYEDPTEFWFAYGEDGTAYLVTTPLTVVTVSTRGPGQTSWTEEEVGWGARATTAVEVGPDGIPRLFYVQLKPGGGPLAVESAERPQ